MARTRKPCAWSWSSSSPRSGSSNGSRSWISSLSSTWVQRLKMASGAPLAMSLRWPSTSTTTDMMRREKSKGISSTLVTLRWGPSVREHRLVEQVLEAGLVKGVEVGQLEDALVLFADHVAVLLEDDPVLGEGPGLVGAQDVHRAEVLDGVEPLDDDLLLRQRDRADGERPDEIIGSISGVSPTATARAKKKASLQSCLVRPLMKNTNTVMTTMKRKSSEADAADAPFEAGQRRAPARLSATLPK